MAGIGLSECGVQPFEQALNLIRSPAELSVAEQGLGLYSAIPVSQRLRPPALAR